MSTNSKTSRKKSTCKMASPISNDRAEAFVGPQAEFLPRFSEFPSERDERAFNLQAKGMTQRQIAKELKTSQSTVHRGIKKYRFWFGSTLPEDRGQLTGWARVRVAIEEQRIFLRHQRELAMEEWHQSRQPVPVKRKRTRLDPEGRKMDGMPIKDIQIDEYVQRRHASAAHLNAAARRSLELTMLEAGYLGVHKLSCNLAIDTDERQRWDRAVKERDAKIEELTRKVAELEAKIAAILGESRNASQSPVVNQTAAGPEVANPIQQAPSGDRPDSLPPVSQRLNQMNPRRIETGFRSRNRGPPPPTSHSPSPVRQSLEKGGNDEIVKLCRLHKVFRLFRKFRPGKLR
jgi:hypothetical protein